MFFAVLPGFVTLDLTCVTINGHFYHVYLYENYLNRQSRILAHITVEYEDVLNHGTWYVEETLYTDIYTCIRKLTCT